MRARRALLYAPGSDPRKMAKAATLEADSVCLDLEDGVAPDRKAEARENVAQALRSLNFEGERCVRINALGSGFETADLAGVLPSQPDSIIVPKVSTAEDVRRVSEQIAALERAHNWQMGSIRLLAMIESARGVVNLREIAAADERLDALIFGAEDYAADVGATRTRDGWEVWFARSAVVAHCAAFGLQAIDLLYLDFRDRDGLRAEARRGAQLGFGGMQVIHPDQIAPVQEAFTPDSAAVTQAQRVVDGYRDNLMKGKGAFALDGRMVDLPIVRAAERVLERARAARKK